VSREADVIALREAVLTAHGSLDILVNSAGVSPVYVPLERTDLSDWRQVIDVNLGGMFLCCRHLGTIMLDKGRGSIINVSSIGGHVGLERQAAYCASKGGVEQLTRSLALDWAQKGVRVNAIAYGFIETDLTAGIRASEYFSAKLLNRTPMGRFGTLDEVAGAAVFLASPAAAFVTGASIPVDGGWTAG
jgi:gluconate 5-dehydrogenase